MAQGKTKEGRLYNQGVRMSLLDNDLIRVNVKREVCERVIHYYNDFGWKLLEEKDDKRYFDLIHPTFVRPHYIDNKDDLCILQARLELAMNRIALHRGKIRSRATIFGGILGVLCLFLSVGGLLSMIFSSGLSMMIFGVLMVIFGASMSAYTYFLIRRIYKKDSEKYQKLIDNERTIIKEYRDEARRIRGAV